MSGCSAPLGFGLLPSTPARSSPSQFISLEFSIGSLQNPTFLESSIGRRWAAHKRPTVKNIFEKPENDHLPLIEASRLCNRDILSHVQQVMCFAFHDSRLLMETCEEAKRLRKIVTLFYLD